MFLNSNPFAKIESGNVYYYHNDHLGTPQKMTDSAGSTVWYGEFLPFGESMSITGTITNNLRFPGQYYDDETGLHYNYFRDYKPMIGRYVEADPIGIKKGENHLYGYVHNRPLISTDAEGLAMLIRPPDGRGCAPWGYHIPDPYGFIECCGGHDDCCKNCEKPKLQCDGDFCRCLFGKCGEYQPGQNQRKRSACYSDAASYCGLVVGGGYLAYPPKCYCTLKY